MRTLALATACLVMLGAGPALAMSCCGGNRGKAPMCGKAGMAMSHGTMKGKKAHACCCQGMAGPMSRRS